MNARSALFDVFGDHVRARGGQAPVAALVRLLAPLGISGPAVRTAVSRMVRQGWLLSTPTPTGPGYALTPRARRRLDQAAARIYRTGEIAWDGSWHLVVVERSSDRGRRERVRSALAFLGYAPLADDTWISATGSDEVAATLAAENTRGHTFVTSPGEDPRALAHQVWDLDGLAGSYSRWLAGATSIVDHPTGDDERAFAVRSRLLHEWRKFLFTDPGLPRDLLPTPWAGDEAAAFFDQHASRLLPAANSFVDDCLGPITTPTRSTA